jgi:hypothetical protein
MQYFKVEYEAGLFCGGTAYIRAMSRDGARKQVRRANLLVKRSLKRIPFSEYQQAQKSPNKVKPPMRTAKERVRDFMSRPEYNDTVLTAVRTLAKYVGTQASLARALGVLLVTTGDIGYLADNDPMGVIQALEALGLKVPE